MAKSDIVYAVNSLAERSERQLRKQLYSREQIQGSA